MTNLLHPVTGQVKESSEIKTKEGPGTWSRWSPAFNPLTVKKQSN